jgi:hypothetical protein
MDLTDALEEGSEPLHLQQLQLMAVQLREVQQNSDSVTWVPEAIPTFVQQAVKEALAATAEGELLLANATFSLGSIILACCCHTSALADVKTVTSGVISRVLQILHQPPTHSSSRCLPAAPQRQPAHNTRHMQQHQASQQTKHTTVNTCMLAASTSTMLQRAGMQQQGIAALLQACSSQKGLQEQACIQQQALQENTWAQKWLLQPLMQGLQCWQEARCCAATQPSMGALVGLQLAA